VITILALYSITSGALALFVAWLLSPTCRPNPFSVYYRFYALSLFVSTVTRIRILLTVTACQFSRFSRTLIYFPSFSALVRVYVCAFMAMSVHAFPLLYVSFMGAFTSLQTQLA